MVSSRNQVLFFLSTSAGQQQFMKFLIFILDYGGQQHFMKYCNTTSGGQQLLIENLEQPQNWFRFDVDF